MESVVQEEDDGGALGVDEVRGVEVDAERVGEARRDDFDEERFVGENVNKERRMV